MTVDAITYLEDLIKEGNLEEHMIIELDGMKINSMQKVGEMLPKFPNVESISMIACGLTSLAGFPKLPNLKAILLTDNRIAGGLETLVESCPNLEHIDLSANRISSVNDLKPLAALKDLQELRIISTPLAVGDEENYRTEVFKVLPNVVVDLDDDEDDEDDDDDEDDEYEEEDDQGRPLPSSKKAKTEELGTAKLLEGDLSDDEEDYEEGEDGEDEDDDFVEDDEEEEEA